MNKNGLQDLESDFYEKDCCRPTMHCKVCSHQLDDYIRNSMRHTHIRQSNRDSRKLFTKFCFQPLPKHEMLQLTSSLLEMLQNDKVCSSSKEHDADKLMRDRGQGSRTCLASIRAMGFDLIVQLVHMYRAHIKGDTLGLSLSYFQRCLLSDTLPSNYQKSIEFPAACFFIANKLEEVSSPDINELAVLTNTTSANLLKMEKIVLETLSFELYPVTLSKMIGCLFSLAPDTMGDVRLFANRFVQLNPAIFLTSTSPGVLTSALLWLIHREFDLSAEDWFWVPPDLLVWLPKQNELDMPLTPCTPSSLVTNKKMLCEVTQVAVALHKMASKCS
eukprot:749103-Hanusia_phi.AAC.1